MALEPPNDSVGDVLAAEVDEGLLTLSTIHSAKGLEWRAVFVIGMVDGRFPSLFNLRDENDVEEERRLLYVAVTRAKEHLYLTYPIDVYDRSTGMVLGKPSRFVDGLPSALLPGLQVVGRISNGRERTSCNEPLDVVLRRHDVATDADDRHGARPSGCGPRDRACRLG
jgi:DNA helicase-2/ATP-dependent DNA helicase PcrA